MAITGQKSALFISMYIELVYRILVYCILVCLASHISKPCWDNKLVHQHFLFNTTTKLHHFHTLDVIPFTAASFMGLLVTKKKKSFVVCVCVRARVRACVRACVRVCGMWNVSAV